MSTPQLATDYFLGDVLPADVWYGKYALRDWKTQEVLEVTPDDMHWRMAHEFARIEQRKFKDPWSADRIHGWFRDFATLIPQGSPMSGIGSDRYQTVGNCYIVTPPSDSYGGIMRSDELLAQVCKRRGGVGVDISKIRPADLPTTNSSRTSTGIVPYMERFSNTIREVCQNGRRGALMITISCHHPQVLDFSRAKLDPTKVTGANVSVRLSDEFLTAVRKGEKYEQRWPVDSKHPVVSRWVDARGVWREIIACAHARAEPGILFWDNVINQSPSDCYSDDGFRTISTNPCVTSDTWVMTSEGPRQVHNLVGTKFTAVVNGKAYACPTGFWSTGVKPVYELTTKSGFKVRATANHRIKVSREIGAGLMELDWEELGELQVGDYLKMSDHRRLESWTGAGTEAEGWLVGSLLGDGCYTKSDAYAILEYWGDHRDHMHRYAVSMLKDAGASDRWNLGKVKTGKTRKSHRIYCVGLKSLGEKFGVGYDKGLLPVVEETSSDFYRGFLRGWFDADGCVLVKGRRIDLGSVVRGNLQVAQRMLARLGIRSRINVRGAAGEKEMPDGKGGVKTYRTKAVYGLTVTGADMARFAEVIGFTEPAKIRRLDELLGSFTRRLYDHAFHDEVASVRWVGEEEVYDCTVDGVHEFDGNGFRLHNCGEIPMNEDSCRLLVVNLFSCVTNPFTKRAQFDFDRLSEHAGYAQRLMDDLVDIEVEKIDHILGKIDSDPEDEDAKNRERELWLKFRRNCVNGRRTGTGITALGDAMAAVGVSYGSDESIEFTGKVYKTLKLGAYRQSVEMAKELGAFPVWDPKKEENNPFLLRIREEDPKLYKDMQKHGRRNIALLTTAPTGSTSILAGPRPYFGTTSGIEPLFTDIPYTRRKKINHADKDARVDFTDANGDRWTEYPVYHSKIKMWMDVTGETDYTKSPYHGCCAEDLDWTQRVKLQAAAQEHVCHAISSTVNVPNDITVEKVAEIYETAWAANLKGITIYRKGCRDGVLVDAKPKEPTEVVRTVAPKRPKDLPCHVQVLKGGGRRYFVIVGLLGPDPYEVFAGDVVENDPIAAFADGERVPGTLRKLSRGRYVLVSPGGDVVQDDVAGRLTPDEQGYTRLASTALRHGTDIRFLVEQLSKTGGALTSFVKVMARALKAYVPDGVKVAGATCWSCQAEGTLVFQEGCSTCKSCGASKCS